MNRFLYIDGHNLAFRAYHTLGRNLTHNDVQVGVVFGFLRDVRMLADRYPETTMVFAWDRGPGLREQKFPFYKESRRGDNVPPAEAAVKAEVRRQAGLLRREYLPALGYPNHHHAVGYEGDDIIAAAVQSLGPNDEAIIVSTDGDMLQCLAGNVRIHNPYNHRVITLQTFYAEWGILPCDWPHVKALAGCGTDDVPGIKGVAETKASQYISNSPKLKPKHKAYQAIESEAGQALWRRNLELVTLPYPGCPVFGVLPDTPDGSKWRAIAQRLNMKTLLNG